jgi:hypothetical protein
VHISSQKLKLHQNLRRKSTGTLLELNYSNDMVALYFVSKQDLVFHKHGPKNAHLNYTMLLNEIIDKETAK